MSVVGFFWNPWWLKLSEGSAHPVDGHSFIFELIGSLDDDEDRAGDQVMRFQNPIHGSLWC